jgi:uncharacterized surface anchored protein
LTPVKHLSYLLLVMALCATVGVIGCGGGGGVVAGEITGSVLDAQQQRGVSGATVTVDGTPYTTDSSGKYRLPALAPGTYTITATATGYTTAGPLNVTITSGTKTLPPIYIVRTAEAPPDPPDL